MTFDDVKDEIHGLPTRTLTSNELEVFAEKVWQAATDAERNRINALVIKVRAQGNFAGTAWWDAAEEIRRIIHDPT